MHFAYSLDSLHAKDTNRTVAASVPHSNLSATSKGEPNEYTQALFQK